MDDVTIKVRENGPLLVTGPVTLVDHDGNVFETGGNCVLCRCGASGRKPFCDGTHSAMPDAAQRPGAPFDGTCVMPDQD